MKNETQEISILDLCLMPESLQDAPDLYRCLGCDPQITRYTGWNPYITLQSTLDKIEQDIRAEDGSYSWVIKKDGMFIGTIGAYDYHPQDMSIEIGYSIAREYWGNGYAGAAAKAVVAYLQAQPQIRSIRAWSHRENAASIKVLLAAGFKQIRTNEEQLIFENRWG